MDTRCCDLSRTISYFVIFHLHLQKLSNSQAPRSRNNGTLKHHDVVIYVDVENPEIIDRVTFDFQHESFHPKKFVHSSPIPIQKPNGSQAWRFGTRQQLYGPV